MRQIADQDVVPPIEPIGDLPARVRDLVESQGIGFRENTDFDAPGPTQRAVVAIADGAQFMLIHHYGHPDCFIELRGQTSTATAAELRHRFVEDLGLSDSEFLST